MNAVKPDRLIRVRATIYHCGVCGKRIAMQIPICKNCGTPVDWSNWFPVKKKDGAR